jgi:hypothetical protein
MYEMPVSDTLQTLKARVPEGYGSMAKQRIERSVFSRIG